MKLRNRISILLFALFMAFGLTACQDSSKEKQPGSHTAETEVQTASNSSQKNISVNNIPDYSGKMYVELNGSRPEFQSRELKTKSYESYSKLDSLGRCGTAQANIGKDIMPTKKRGAIGMVKPTGWHTVKYSNVDGKYLYNRCHLIGYQLTGENANEKNLITGTRAMNVDGMLPFEDMVADYVKETGNLRKKTWSQKAFRWKLCLWKTEERILNLMSSYITYSLESPLTIKQGKAKKHRIQRLRQPLQRKNDMPKAARAITMNPSISAATQDLRFITAQDRGIMKK